MTLNPRDAHVQTQSERDNDAAQVMRIYAQLPSVEREAQAYQHASHGCPNGDAPCDLCDGTDEPCFV